MHKDYEAKVKQFISDPMMSVAVKQVLLDSLLQKRDRTDVHLTAAATIAIDLFNEAWKEIEKYKTKESSEMKGREQVGL